MPLDIHIITQFNITKSNKIIFLILLCMLLMINAIGPAPYLHGAFHTATSSGEQILFITKNYGIILTREMTCSHELWGPFETDKRK